MSAKHRSPEYAKNARIVRQRVKAAHRAGREVHCWRCGGLIDEAQAFDVGHVHDAPGNRLEDLAPEHRYRVGRCRGNRSAGGRLGAIKTNGGRATTKGLLGW